MKENSIFYKIVNFIKSIFKSQKALLPAVDEQESSQKNIDICQEKANQNIVKEMDKQQFLDMYEKTKKGEVDILSTDPDITEKICMLLTEEIKLKEKLLDKKLTQIATIKENINKLAVNTDINE